MSRRIIPSLVRLQQSLFNKYHPEQRIVIALGGNAIQNSTEKGTAEEMMNNIETASEQISQLVNIEGIKRKLILTHGNGPQIGSIYLQNQQCAEITPSLPLYLCGAQSIGSIGFMLQRALQNRLSEYNVMSLITQVLVDKEDDAWNNPTKPIGKYYTKHETDQLKMENAANKQFVMMEDKYRGGYRICVASPSPIDIVESDKNVIQTLVDDENMNNLVICCGGGGIPIIMDEKNMIQPMDKAVIDKDLTAVRLAVAVNADYLVIATDIDRVYLNFDIYDSEHDMVQRMALYQVTVKEVKQHFDAGHFGKGSMGPKVQAAMQFVQMTGKVCVICALKDIQQAIKGETGTLIIP